MQNVLYKQSVIYYHFKSTGITIFYVKFSKNKVEPQQKILNNKWCRVKAIPVKGLLFENARYVLIVRIIQKKNAHTKYPPYACLDKHKKNAPFFLTAFSLFVIPSLDIFICQLDCCTGRRVFRIFFFSIYGRFFKNCFKLI